MEQVDPITVATIWHFLQRVCIEMRETMERTATNVLATTLHDLAYGIWDAKAQAVAIPEGFPCRLISSSYPIRAVLKIFEGQIDPGDVFLTNHPFKAGAVHLPDWVFVRPIFYKDELVFFTCMGTHVPDNGGAQAGAYFLANDSIAEGLNIPPIKIVEKGKMREDVLELILSNNRLPDMMRREIHSLIGSTGVAERRVIELLNKYGQETVFSSLEEMMERTEKAVRAEIAKWPDGTYYSEAQTDDDGLTMDSPVTIRCKLTITGDEATFDFSESDDQQKGYINAPFPVTLSQALTTSFLFLDPELKSYHNEGSVKPFHVITKEGTFVHAKPGALTAAAPSMAGSMVVQCVMAVLSQALPDHAVAPYGRPLHIMMIGIDPRTNQLYAYISFCPAGAAGAVYGYDGYQCCCDMGTLGVVSKTDAEEEMVRFPWRVSRYEFRTDSNGAGKWRGSSGLWWEGINEGNDCTSICGPNDGFQTQWSGQQGGQATPVNKAYILRGEEKIDIIHPHIIQKLKAQDVFVGNSGGGAGVGKPEERDPEAVRMDVRNELVSIAAARDTYKVVLNPNTLEVDQQATIKLRNN
ncbi:hydantoinase B/oxoprolinase family protein [Chloroflexota bacterium]